MSYDIWLTIDTGGPEPHVITGGGNVTSNVAPMWRLAGADLAEFDGLLAGNCLPALRAAVTAMETDPDKYKALNPPNGWGSYDTCLRFLRELLTDFEANPQATVRVSR